MAEKTCLICNCEGTMAPDAKALSTLDGVTVSRVHTQLCRAQLGSFEAALAAEDGPLMVACTQEAPLFQEVADEVGRGVDFVNIRETAGWSEDGVVSGPKMAALLAGAVYEVEPARGREVQSDGLCLIYGDDQNAVDMAVLLAPRLSVTLLLQDPADVILPSVMDFPVFQGQIKSLAGALGAFDLVVDGYAPLRPSSRGALQFEDTRDGARSTCSLVLDLSGGQPLVTGPKKRDGYERPDPKGPAAVLRAAFTLSDMVGTFEKPIYVSQTPETCAHSRSQISGCTKCLDVCPAGAITSNGDAVAVDAAICGGCGACAAVCPTGSITYAYPARPDRLGQAQAMLQAFEAAGGRDPHLLIHAGASEAVLGALARFGRGLPAFVIPWARHDVTGVGHLEICALVAAGAASVIVFADPSKADELPVLHGEVDLANAILAGLGVQHGRARVMETNDPDVLEAGVWQMEAPASLTAARISDTGGPRDLARLVFTGIAGQTGVSGDVPMPTGAPYGAVEINQDACTLCMACTSACPTGAMMDTPGEPHLRFAETACVQCGLCVSTCPESALALKPRLNLSLDAIQPVTLKQEEPFQCISCGAEFATKSTIEKIKAQLAGQHSMFATDERARLIEMCDNCKIEAQANSDEDPFAMGQRPKVRTTEDYQSGSLSDFLIDD